MVTNKISKIKKKDGRVVDFEQQKITDAIFKALTATTQGDGKRAKRLSDRVVQILNRRFKKEEIPHVEQIQDIVEEVLILEGLVETAKAYILYREQRRRIREAVTVAEEAVDKIDQYLEKLDWEVQENANMAFSLQGLRIYFWSNRYCWRKGCPLLPFGKRKGRQQPRSQGGCMQWCGFQPQHA